FSKNCDYSGEDLRSFSENSDSFGNCQNYSGKKCLSSDIVIIAEKSRLNPAKIVRLFLLNLSGNIRVANLDNLFNYFNENRRYFSKINSATLKQHFNLPTYKGL